MKGDQAEVTSLITQLLKDINNLNALNTEIKKLSTKKNAGNTSINLIGCGPSANELL